MMRAATIALCLVPLLGGCDKKKPDGLPPATDWQAPAAGSSVPMPSNGGGGPATADPHARVPGKFDKDRFRLGLGGVAQAYQEVARRLGIAPEVRPADLAIAP